MILSIEESGMGNRTTDSSRTSVSVREVREATYRLLCASGVSPGVASRAAAMVLFSEVHHGDGLLWLYRQLDLIERGSADPRRLRLCQESESVTRIEATDATALTAGPPTLDLLCERAESAGAWAVRLVGARDLPLLREPAYRVASRGLACGIFWSRVREAGEGPVPEALLAMPVPEGVKISEDQGTPEGLAALVEGLLREKPEEGLTGAVQEMIRTLSRTGTGGSEAVIVCLRADEPLEDPCVESSVVTVHGERELAREWNSACTHGIRVDSEVWSAVYSASRRMLVPETSESGEDQR